MQSSKPDPDDKDSYVQYGYKEEVKFVDRVAPSLGIDAELNPEKESNKYAIDLLVGDTLTDLKKQETPFFTSRDKFGIPPQFCVTFNTNDFQRYTEKAADKPIDILYWINWQERENFGKTVSEMAGLWRVSVNKIRDWVESGAVSSHRYKRRDSHGKNAVSSYGLDLREMDQLAVVGPQNNYQGTVQNSVLFL